MWSKLIPSEHYTVLDQSTLEGRDAVYDQIPEALDPRVKSVISAHHPQLYRHQSEAIKAFLSGDDICLGTSTASGKSLVFMTCVAETLLKDSLSRAIVLYPAKALISDQLSRWKSWTKDLGLKVGHVHGDVPVDNRLAALYSNRILLMTPDVLHTWLMLNVSDNRIRAFLDKVSVLVLDEAHVYEGVFGSNMAFLMRRFDAVTQSPRLILTTATLGQPTEFARKLTGREIICFGKDDDTSKTARKAIVVVTERTSEPFQAKVQLLRKLRDRKKGRFLAFADSRKMVEMLTVAVSTEKMDGEVEEDENTPLDLSGDADDKALLDAQDAVLPYRSGYEDEDRERIQRALSGGQLAGVVSTSALELGLDIGDLDLVVLFGVPPTIKSFWQRIGRAGRRDAGTCIVVDSGATINSVFGSLDAYLERPLEPNWLYLDNKKIQYANALCAAIEVQKSNKRIEKIFSTLPAEFLAYYQNEVNPVRPVETELLSLRQRAVGGPHYEFPMRSAMEPSYRIKNGGHRMGTVTFQQALREAYPGAVYYHMAKPYRVKLFNTREKEIIVQRERRWKTSPTAGTKVFPDFQNSVYFLRRSSEGFLVESGMQVSDRVLGFKETRGKTISAHKYEAGSAYYHRPLIRFFSTTGVCWCFPGSSVSGLAVAEAILAAYCTHFGIDARDISCGQFHANSSPIGSEPVKGVTIFDSTDGSLRLTQRLAAHFDDVLNVAISMAEGGNSQIHCGADDLRQLQLLCNGLADIGSELVDASKESEDGWINVIARDENAVYSSDGANINVKVLSYIYTPQGLKYRVQFDGSQPARLIISDFIVPLHGETRFVRVNLNSAEEESLD